MLMNERLVRVQACIRKLAWLPPESSTVPFCKEEDGYGYGYFLAPDAVFIMWTQETDTTYQCIMLCLLTQKTYHSRDIINFLPCSVVVLGPAVGCNQFPDGF